MESLYNKTGEKWPIWAVGHAGHDCAGQEHLIPARPCRVRFKGSYVLWSNDGATTLSITTLDIMSFNKTMK